MLKVAYGQSKMIYIFGGLSQKYKKQLLNILRAIIMTMTTTQDTLLRTVKRLI